MRCNLHQVPSQRWAGVWRAETRLWPASYSGLKQSSGFLHSAVKLSVNRRVASGAAGGCFLNLLCLHSEVFFFTLTKPTARLVGVWNQRRVVSAHLLLPGKCVKRLSLAFHTRPFWKDEAKPRSFVRWQVNTRTWRSSLPLLLFFFFFLLARVEMFSGLMVSRPSASASSIDESAPL